MGSTNFGLTDTARVLYGRNSRLTESGSFQLGDRARYAEGGSIGDGNTIRSGTDLSRATLTGSTVNIGDPGLGDTFAQTVRDLNTQTTGALSAFANTLSEAFGGKANGLPDAGNDLPTTEDNAGRGKKWMIVAGLAAAALLAFLIFRKR